MSDLQEIIASQSIKAYNQGYNDAIGKHQQILDGHEAGLIKISAISLQEGIKAERKRILSFITDPKLIELINQDNPCGDCEGDCCGRL
jgi:hypothetical protein